MSLWNTSIEVFMATMRAEGMSRAFVVTDPDTARVNASHPVLRTLADAMASDGRDFDGHEGCFFEIGRESGHLLTAFIHKTRRGQAVGGVRFWTYDTVEALCRDGLRLSKGMGHKCALAGMWWGGGKGVIARRADQDHHDPDVRGAVYRDYGRFMSGLSGCYVTAEDAGTMPADMARVFAMTRHTTCIPPEFGGSGNPSILTAQGVVIAMEAALEWSGLGELAGKTVALQGLGNVAYYMIPELLARRVGRIIGVDIEAGVVDRALREFGDVVQARVVDPSDMSICGEPCDVFSPCAVGGTINPATIEQIEATVVCGAANNQLEDPQRDDALLRDRGVLYVPDFLANRMGIVNCANEPYGVIDNDPVIQAHLDRTTAHGVFRRALEVFERARQSGRPTGAEAIAMAEELAEELHPLWGHRGQDIIDHLVRSGWADGEPVGV